MSVFCLTGLLLNLFLVIPIFASWKLSYAHVGASQNMHLGGKKKLILKIGYKAFFRGSIQIWVSASVILCFVGETKPCAFTVPSTQPQKRMNESSLVTSLRI